MKKCLGSIIHRWESINAFDQNVSELHTEEDINTQSTVFILTLFCFENYLSDSAFVDNFSSLSIMSQT